MHFYKLMLVTNKAEISIEKYMEFIVACAGAGITSVQLREKNLGCKDLIAFGRELKKTLKPFNIPLIVNDDINLAVELDAEGLHLGQKDGEINNARKRLGDNKIIGLSISSVLETQQANCLPLDYVGCGAIFPTVSKSDAAHVGLLELKRICEISRHKVVAIGGINENNIDKVIIAGVHGIAAIKMFHQSNNLVTMARKLYNNT